MTDSTIIQLTEDSDMFDFRRDHDQVSGLGGDDVFTAVDRKPYTDVSLDGGDGTDSLVRDGTLRLGDGVAFSNMEILDVDRVKITSGATVDLSDFETSTATRIVGSSGNETIIGTQDADMIHTGRGDDTVLAGAGDEVRMGRGNDTLQFVQDGTAVIDVNDRGNGTVTYGNGDTIRFWGVENFEEISLPDPLTEYVLDFNDNMRFADGDTLFDGLFTASVSKGQYDINGLVIPSEYDGTDPDLEAFNSWGATVGFARTDGEDFDFASLSLANASRADTTYIPEGNWANTVQINGYDDGLLIYSETVDLTFEHQTVDLNWQGIDQIEFVATGGGISNDHVENAGWFSMDDLVFLA